MNASKSSGGITLVELMTTLSVAAITLTLGVPGFKGLQTSMQRSQATMELSASFALARSEAVRRGTTVTICPSPDGVACSGSQSASWESGWVVFADLDGNSILEAGTDETIQRVSYAPGAFSITAQPQVAGGVTYNASGLPGITGRYTLCDKQESKDLVLTPIGRIEQVVTGPGCN
jgi:type IV fimbrial biogenesis protein FimT